MFSKLLWHKVLNQPPKALQSKTERGQTSTLGLYGIWQCHKTASSWRQTTVLNYFSYWLGRESTRDNVKKTTADHRSVSLHWNTLLLFHQRAVLSCLAHFCSPLLGAFSPAKVLVQHRGGAGCILLFKPLLMVPPPAPDTHLFAAFLECQEANQFYLIRLSMCHYQCLYLFVCHSAWATIVFM